MAIKITYNVNDTALVADVQADSVVIGRPTAEAGVDVDLSLDRAVSRRHARIWRDGPRHWIEDLGSRHGTYVNEERIESPRALGPGDVVRLGSTTLTVAEPEQVIQIVQTRDAMLDGLHAHSAEPEAARQLAVLCTLLPQLAAQIDLDRVLEMITERVIEAIPGAARSALLVKHGDAIILKAHVPLLGDPSVSLTLARRAMELREAISWRRAIDPTESQLRLGIEAGMYAPLLWKGEPLGVLCVDTRAQREVFSPESLRFLVAVAHHAAVAIAQRQLQDDLQRQTVRLEHLLHDLSARNVDIEAALRDLHAAQDGLVREASLRTQLERYVSPRLVEAAVANPELLDLPGDWREATVLFADIRGFTRLIERTAPAVVIQLLDEYFKEMMGIVFRHDGTVEQLIGDEIVALFGVHEGEQGVAADRAVRAALEMTTAVGALSERWKSAGLPTFDIGVGLSSGRLIAGTIGSGRRRELIVLGRPMIAAARIQRMTRLFGVHIIASEETFRQVSDRVRSRELGSPKLKGLAHRSTLHEILGSKMSVTAGEGG